MTGPGVFHTTLNWPSALVSPINPDFCKSWFFSSILLTMPDGALNVCPACHGAIAGFWRPAGSRSMRRVMYEQQHHHQGRHDLWGCKNRLLRLKRLLVQAFIARAAINFIASQRIKSSPLPGRRCFPFFTAHQAKLLCRRQSNLPASISGSRWGWACDGHWQRMNSLRGSHRTQ